MSNQQASEEYTGDRRGHWHVDRSVNIATMISLGMLSIALISLAGAGISAWNDLNSRVTANAVQIIAIDAVNARQDQQQYHEQQRTQQLLDAISNKIDRLLESRSQSTGGANR